MKQNGAPNQCLDKHEHVEWNALEEVNHAIETFRPGIAERIQGQMLNHIEANGDDSGQRVQLVPEVAFLTHGHGEFDLTPVPFRW